MELKLNESQYKNLFSGIMREFRYARDFYLMGTGGATIKDFNDSYNSYEDFHTKFVESLMQTVENQLGIDITESWHNFYGFRQIEIGE
jgi:hypothetical protein